MTIFCQRKSTMPECPRDTSPLIVSKPTNGQHTEPKHFLQDQQKKRGEEKRKERKKERKHELNQLLKNKLPGGTWDKMVTVLGTRGALACTASFTILSGTKRYSPDGFLTGQIGVLQGKFGQRTRAPLSTNALWE